MHLTFNFLSFVIRSDCGRGSKYCSWLNSVVAKVLARGGIVTQGAQQLDTLATRISLNIDVTHDMAPTAQIIAYVIKSDGEVVADSLSVSVSNAFENAVSVWCMVVFVVCLCYFVFVM